MIPVTGVLCIDLLRLLDRLAEARRRKIVRLFLCFCPCLCFLLGLSLCLLYRRLSFLITFGSNTLALPRRRRSIIT